MGGGAGSAHGDASIFKWLARSPAMGWRGESSVYAMARRAGDCFARRRMQLGSFNE
jgi:hypothetical protein